MSCRGPKFHKNAVAKLVTVNRSPCVFCQHEVDDEVIYGKLYSIGDIQCHYYCVLLSCCLVQKGKDEEGLFGFLYKDIIAEVERSKKHRCSYCGRGGASLGCCVSQCRKQFHLPCGREKNVISLFYGNYKSFCELHAPKQKISASVLASAKLRMQRDKAKTRKSVQSTKRETEQILDKEECVCVICYESVPGYPTPQTFWPPCCGRDAWLHRACLQRMALSAGMHYLKCPLCNDKEQFYEAVCSQGYYLPDRDASWELEQNAFAEIYERAVACAAEPCRCPRGRECDEPGIWDIKLCLVCGSWGTHAGCSAPADPESPAAAAAPAAFVCAACRPAVDDVDSLEAKIAQVIQAEQEAESRRARCGPVMPSRMSIRRTKRRTRLHSISTTPEFQPMNIKTEKIKESSPKKQESGRQELNLKLPRRQPRLLEPTVFKDLENKLLSPIKMLEQRYLERVQSSDKEVVLNSREVIEKMRAKFNKPKPLSEKKRIVNEILEDLLNNVFKENKEMKDWNTPKKIRDISDITYELKFKENIQPNNDKPVDIKIKKELAENITEIDLTDDNIHKITEGNTDLIVIENSGDRTAGIKGTLDYHEENAVHCDDLKNDDSVIILNESVGDTISSDDSNSTFQLPPEFIADSDDDLFDTPTKLKTVDMEQNSSLEIFENDEIVNIDVVKMNTSLDKTPERKKCPLKFSPAANETLQSNVDIDIENFKKHYLNEVGGDLKRNKLIKNEDSDFKLPSAIDFDINATMDTPESNKKRKMCSKDRKGKKKRKLVVNYEEASPTKINNEIEKHDNIDKKYRMKFKKPKTKVSISEKNIKVKIKWKKEELKLKITKSKKDKQKRYPNLTQYVLKYSPEQKNVNVIAKPENNVTPKKRKYLKQEKTPDNLVQTSIQSFFKSK